MLTPRAFRPIVRLLPYVLLALLMAGLVDGHVSDTSFTSFAAEVSSLTSGAPLEREIRGGETQTLDLPLKAGTFLFLEISLRTANLSFRLSGPGGEVLAEAGGLGPHLLAAIADREGIYRLEGVASKEQKVSTRFTVKVLDLRPVAPRDEARVQGAKALMEVRRLLSSDEEAQKRQAEVRLAESLAAWQLAGDSRGEVEALLENAKLRSDRGDMTEALVWYEKAAELSRRSGFAEGEARALYGIGFCNDQLTHYDEAASFYLRALEIWRVAGRPYEQAFVLQALGNTHLRRKKDLEVTLKVFEEARSLAETTGDLSLLARTLSGVGACHYQKYSLGKARETWEKALDLSRQAGDERTEASLEQNLAAVYMNQGHLQKALGLLIRAVGRISVRDSGMKRYNMGILYLELGMPEEALESYRISQQVFKATGNSGNEASALIGIGWALRRKGNPQAALAEYEKAQSLVQKKSWSVLHSIGVVQIDLGNPKAAKLLLEQALDSARMDYDRSQEAATLFALGSAHADLGQTDKAMEYLENAIDLGSEIGYQRVVALALLKRCQLRREQGNLIGALADVERALTVVESTRRNIAGDQLRTGFFAAKRAYYDLDIDLLLKLDRLEPKGGYRARAFEASERARARGLLDLLAEGRIDIRQGLDPDLRRQEDELADQISRIQSELRTGGAKPERLEELRAERDVLEVRRKQLEVEIQTKNKRYAEVRYPVPLKLDEIRRRLLDDRTALFEYVLAEKSSTLFVITQERIETYELPAAQKITQETVRLREALEQESFLQRKIYLDSAFRLYQDLVAPAAAALAGKSNLLIVPDGVLHYLPFEALLSEPADRSFRELPYLLRNYSIAYIPSASVLAGLREPRQDLVPAVRKEVVAFAPFATSKPETAVRRAEQRSSLTSANNRWIFNPLPASGREIEGIVGLYPGAAESFVGGEADEAAVTSNPAVITARRLHFATHAQIDERNPEFSALVLAQRPGEDGFLQVGEIFNMKLSADLAVLSACETALGKEVTGEGLVGLTRAFFYAGVPSLVVSLWNVVDGPTPDLMLDFYKNLDRFQDKARALQTSKLAMIDRGTYSHPSYWAPFILLGEPR